MPPTTDQPDNSSGKQAGGTWTRSEITPDAPQALTLSHNNVIVATDRGTFTTSGLGNVWMTVSGNPRQPLSCHNEHYQLSAKGVFTPAGG